jgi:hypothetical protein
MCAGRQRRTLALNNFIPDGGARHGSYAAVYSLQNFDESVHLSFGGVTQ